MTPPDKIHIVHVAGSAQWAGGEVFLQQMAERLDRSRFEMRVICPEEGPLQEEMEKRGIPCRVIPLEPLGDPRPLFSLKKCFSEWSADLIQSHGARSNFYTRLAAGRIPAISTIHNALTDYPIPFLKMKLYSIMDALSMPFATRVVCVADALKIEVIGRMPSCASKVSVIHNGVDVEKFNPTRHERRRARKSLSLNGEWTLGVIGRLTPQKGHIYLYEALRQMKDILPAFQLLVIGDGPLRTELERTCSKFGLTDHCRFLGVRSDIPELLSALDVLVLPSVSEGFPYTVLEAMAMGVCVVASDVNGVSEIISTGREGYLVPSRQPEEIVMALRAILQNPQEAQKRAAEGRKMVLEEFDMNKALAKWSDLYLTLARRDK